MLAKLRPLIEQRNRVQEDIARVLGEGETVIQSWVIVKEPTRIPDKKRPIGFRDEDTIRLIRELVAHHKPDTHLTLVRLTWNNDLWVDDAREYLHIHDMTRCGALP